MKTPALSKRGLAERMPKGSNNRARMKRSKSAPYALSAREAMRLAAAKIPIRTKFATRFAQEKML